MSVGPGSADGPGSRWRRRGAGRKRSLALLAEGGGYCFIFHLIRKVQVAVWFNNII